MALKRLPSDLCDLFSASTRINTYKKAVNELVYNALDAKSTCIAIRVNIQESKLQVIDNGQGILQSDMELVGHKNTTSKLLDIANLKAHPHTYGFKGQALSCMVEVSEKVTIISKSSSSSVTSVKSFLRGKSRGVEVEPSSRPSKGTTVEIKGFLYNLPIQKKAINPVNELQSIKCFLQRLALVHNNISISLRDDSANEIAFKIHKCKDIYQTLKTMFDIEENKIKELKVEKKQFKVIAYITKTGVDAVQYNWIYLNGRFMNKCFLHSIVEDSLRKLPEYKNSKRVHNKQRTLLDNYEETIVNKNFPRYFIFIICPYDDYIINDLGNETVVHFKKQDGISTLLQKLVKFYIGDIKIEEVTKNTMKVNDIDTRDKVKEIMNKILEGNSKKIKISQMHNGVKGKVIKRKPKTRDLPNALLKSKANKLTESNHDAQRCDKNWDIPLLHEVEKNNPKSKCKRDKNTGKLRPKDIYNKKCKNKNMKINITSNEIIAQKNISKQTKKMSKNKLKSLVELFSNNNNDIKNRCNLIKEKIDTKMMNFQKTKYPKCFVTNIFHTTQITYKNKTITLDKKIKQVVPKNENISSNELITGKTSHVTKLETHTKLCKTSYDLLQTILKSQSVYETVNTSVRPLTNVDSFSEIKSPPPVISTLKSKIESQDNRLTYDSHTNGKIKLMTKMNNETKKHFIGKHYKDNFKLNVNTSFNRYKSNKNKLRMNLNKYQHQESSFTIKCLSNTNQVDRESTPNTIDENITLNHYTNIKLTANHNEISQHTNSTMNDVIDNTFNTYTIRKTTYFSKKNNVISQMKHVCTDMDKNEIKNSENQKDNAITPIISDENVPTLNIKNIQSNKVSTDQDNHISDSQQQLSPLTIDGVFNPMTVCETIFNKSITEDIQWKDYKMCTQTGLESMELTNIPAPHNSNADNVGDDISHYFDKTIESIFRSYVYIESKEEQVNADNTKIDTAFKTTNINEELNFNTNFEFKTRPRYIPKGMSQIFRNCNTKVDCNYNQDEEYFKDDLYEDFIRDVEINAGAFEANIESVNDYMSKEIQKFNNKVNKDNADLCFDGDSLKTAKVIGQIDCKFIAAKMKCTSGFEEYLILFDQHAVHERIKLETYLSEYFVGRQWKSVKLDGLRINVDLDTTIFLHNYKEKFGQLGLKWAFASDGEINVFEIPQAIIGKNIRQVEVIVKSVKNLILEEIEIIKAQRGSISLYPKAIMDLVFSEACRYAIKFGDKLSTSDCSKLIQDLSKCKTPFQCAHGRPVMAVLIQIRTSYDFYKINKEKLKQFIFTT